MKLYWKEILTQKNDILSEAAQEHINKHIHCRPNGRLGTHYNNIAVTSLATIQPKGMPTRTPFRAYNIHWIFYAVTEPPRQGEATKYPLCSGNSKH